MKKVLLGFVFLYASFCAKAQNVSAVSNLLTPYFTIKNSLVAGEASQAAMQAETFLKVLNGVDTLALSALEQKAFKPLQAKLLKDVNSLATSKDINKQRTVFGNFSNSMIALVKAAAVKDQPLFVEYCPMKKMYWLSEEEAIKNPYYGNMMLGCGMVTETIK